MTHCMALCIKSIMVVPDLGPLAEVMLIKFQYFVTIIQSNLFNISETKTEYWR